MPDSDSINSPYANDSITPIIFEESVRSRPGMYFRSTSSKGIIYAIDQLIKECIELCAAEDFTFNVSINDGNSFSIKINGRTNLSPFLQALTVPIVDYNYLYSRALTVVTTRFELTNDKIHILLTNGQAHAENRHEIEGHHTSLVLCFEIDEKIFPDTNVDYLALNQELVLIPIINRKTEIITRDKRTKYLNQNYYHFPNGIFYVFDSILNSLNGKPNLQIKYEGSIEENEYQIAISGWEWKPSVTSFANYVHTTCHGSLVDGVIDGIILACKKYSNENNLDYFKVTRKKILKNLIIVCAVKGAAFDYGGSFKEKLLSDEVRFQSKKLVSKWIYDYLKNDENVRNSIIRHFDERRLFPFEL
ncbi:hypothetical protein [Mucilaginibacter sp.]|uniref:hypothetical protein n=1 Tax=Mucilaginibacter sp. TaxID=1882438 RepID=UPI0025E1ABE2|nr:hypothetical protein [Mucilaginibacter sp.]